MKCCDSRDAYKVFDWLSDRDLVSWGADGVYLEIRDGGVVIDPTTFVVVLKACFGELVFWGFRFMGFFKWGLIVMWFLEVCCCICLRNVKDWKSRVLDKMPEKNWVLSWSVLIASCIQISEFFLGLYLFRQMQINGIGVSKSVYALVFSDNVKMYLHWVFGSQMHGHTMKENFGSDIIVGTATLDMCWKCG